MIVVLAASLVCAGSGLVETSDMQKDLSWKTNTISETWQFELTIDPDAKTVLRDGKPMNVRAFDGDSVTFSSRPPGLMAALTQPNVYVLSRRTGIIRYGSGSGRCAVAETAPLF